MRLYPIATEQVFFHFDSARDWLWVREMVASKKPQLVGPWSSLNGVFYGPLTYYLLVPFYIAFDGNPIAGSVAKKCTISIMVSGIWQGNAIG